MESAKRQDIEKTTKVVTARDNIAEERRKALKG